MFIVHTLKNQEQNFDVTFSVLLGTLAGHDSKLTSSESIKFIEKSDHTWNRKQFFTFSN